MNLKSIFVILLFADLIASAMITSWAISTGEPFPTAQWTSELGLFIFFICFGMIGAVFVLPIMGISELILHFLERKKGKKI